MAGEKAKKATAKKKLGPKIIGIDSKVKKRLKNPRKESLAGAQTWS